MPNILHNSLNQQVANFAVIYSKLHHYHWFVKGNSFFTLHELFQTDYEEFSTHLDDVAERLIQIGGTPSSTLSEFLTLTTLKENQKDSITKDSMVSSLINDYKQLVTEFNTVIDNAGTYNDKVTEDLFIGLSASLQKKIWLYESFLG